MLKEEGKCENAMKAKSKIKINKGKLISRLGCVFVIIVLINCAVSLVKYPERYLTTWKYQLESDLKKGNQDAIQYYNETYVDSGNLLFGDKYIIEK